ncbi:class I SAM-dependent methyltransferase [Frankia sp. CN7]|nr:class I SAM-dependent methyltransferase [Frankia nepalensis]
MTSEQAGRWETVLDTLAGMLPPGAVRVLVDGAGGEDVPRLFADRLAASVSAAGRRGRRAGAGPTAGAGPAGGAGPAAGGDTPDGAAGAGTVVLADGPRRRADSPPGGWDVVVWLHTRAGRDEEGERGADVVVDVDDPAWPVIRRVAARLAGDGSWFARETDAFFSVRAATWDAKFGDDLPAYAAAVRAMGLRAGAVALDAGCGTGRALPALRDAVGPAGRVIGLDLTPLMLRAAREAGRAVGVTLLVADARHLSVANGAVDAVFAAGLVHHLPDMAAGLAELARISRPGGRLAIFHPSGRAALAARHGRALRPDEPLAAGRLGPMLAASGWHLDSYDDAAHRFLALATRG